jgi:putative phage-type endonuclease
MHPQVEFLLKQEQPEQRTKEWYEARQTRITASAVSSLLTRNEEVCKQYVDAYGLEDIFDYDGKSCNKYSSKQQFILDKCRSNFSSSQATVWGNKYESVALDIYSRNNDNVKLIEFGLISHATLPWLAASPDSITENGVMVEIKCPYRRKITGIPCLTYHQQVQIQLEVCDLEECDFAEYEFKEVDTINEFIQAENNCSGEPVKDKGIFIQIEDIPDNFDNRRYYYPDKSMINNVQALVKWADDKILDIIEENNYTVVSGDDQSITCVDDKYKRISIKKIYWKVMIESVVRIKRSREWFEAMKPILKKEWDYVIHYRDNIYPNQQEEAKPSRSRSKVANRKKREEETDCLF